MEAYGCRMYIYIERKVPWGRPGLSRHVAEVFSGKQRVRRKIDFPFFYSAKGPLYFTSRKKTRLNFKKMLVYCHVTVR